MDAILNNITEPETIALLLSAATAVVVCLLIWQTFVEKDKLTPRLKSMAKRRAEMKAQALDLAKNKDKQGVAGSMLKRAANKFAKVNKDKNEADSKTLLAQAGIRNKDAVPIYNMLRFIMPVFTGGGMAAYLLLGSGGEKDSMVMDVALIVGAFAGGFFVPTLFVKNKGKKRQAKLRKALPDALDLLVICAEAGLGLDAALARVTREIANSAPELAEDLGLLSIELNFLNERRQAYENVVNRTGLKELNALMNTLLQSEKYGTPLSQGLRVLSDEMRTERLAKAEEKAARLPAILTVPMIIFILPFLFIVLMGPAIMRISDAFTQTGS